MSNYSDLTGDKTKLSIKNRVERYFILASVRCAECDDLHRVVEMHDRVYTADNFQIDSEAEWETEMDNEAKWLGKNVDAVRSVLPELEDEWPESTHALQSQMVR